MIWRCTAPLDGPRMPAAAKTRDRSLARLEVLILLLIALPLLCAPCQARVPNRVLELDGDGDFVQLPSSTFNDLEEATVEGWVRWHDFAYFSQFFAFGTGRQWQAMGINHFETSPTLQFFIYDRGRLGAGRDAALCQRDSHRRERLPR